MNQRHTTQQVARWIADARRVTAFTGAGISTPSGIPDFRSPESGLWDGVDVMQVASLTGFRRDPRPFYAWIRPLLQMTCHAQPNVAHLALRRLEQLDKLTSVITQNIDALHTRAGNQVVYELHGHMRAMTCIQCFREVPAEPYLQAITSGGDVPRCDTCGGTLKPNIILFEEQLPYRPLQAAKDSARHCDVMIVIGSSLEVEPANRLPALAQRNGAKLIIINQTPTCMDRMAHVVLRGDAAEILPDIVQYVETLL